MPETPLSANSPLNTKTHNACREILMGEEDKIIAILRLVRYGNVPLPKAGAHFHVLQLHGNRDIEALATSVLERQSRLHSNAISSYKHAFNTS